MANKAHKIVGFAVKYAQPDANVEKWVKSKAGQEAINEMLIKAQKQSLDRYESQQVSYEQLTTPIAI